MTAQPARVPEDGSFLRSPLPSVDTFARSSGGTPGDEKEFHSGGSDEHVAVLGHNHVLVGKDDVYDFTPVSTLA